MAPATYGLTTQTEEGTEEEHVTHYMPAVGEGSLLLRFLLCRWVDAPAGPGPHAAIDV
jgi:hypothetical protein